MTLTALKSIWGLRLGKLKFENRVRIMKSKYRIAIAILLLISAIVALIYNLSVRKEILYIASAVAVWGTISILVREIVQAKKSK